MSIVKKSKEIVTKWRIHHFFNFIASYGFNRLVTYVSLVTNLNEITRSPKYKIAKKTMSKQTCATI